MNSPTNRLPIVGLITLATTLFLAGCATDNPPTLEERLAQNAETDQVTEADPLKYDLGEVSAEVTRSVEAFGFNYLQLAARASSCGNDQEKSHFEALVKQFEEAKAQRLFYNFKYQGESQGTGRYRAFVMPNVAQYKNLEAFKKDFDLCSSGGRDYPYLVSKDWLLFVGSCSGRGDESGLPDGCTLIKEQVEPTFKLK